MPSARNDYFDRGDNTRDAGVRPLPAVPWNVNREELGNRGLTEQEMDDIVAFLPLFAGQTQPACKQTGHSGLFSIQWRPRSASPPTGPEMQPEG
jgi:hypothetical protein